MPDRHRRGWRWAAVDQARQAGIDALDTLLEVTVVGSFSSIGIASRRALARRWGQWDPVGTMAGKVVAITGGTSGIGLAAAEVLAGAGARLHLVGRDPGRAEQARARVHRAAAAAGWPPSVEVTLADLADPDAVAEVASTLGAAHRALDVLVHGAGALSRHYGTGPDGTETTVAVQVLAPFLLTGLLQPKLAAAGGARVITVTSGGLYTQPFDVAGLVMAPGTYDGAVAYARAKRAQTVLTGELARRLADDHVICHAMHPGWVDTPGLRSGLPRFAEVLAPLLRSPADGADTVAWLASVSEPQRSSGALWHDRRRRSPYRLPWTWASRSTEEAQGAALWGWCADRQPWNPASHPGARQAIFP